MKMNRITFNEEGGIRPSAVILAVFLALRPEPLPAVAQAQSGE